MIPGGPATTADYDVVMTTPVVSIRFSDPRHHQRLKAAAERAATSVSPLAERLIEEGLRMADHPQVIFRDGPAGRRPVLLAGPEVADVIGMLVGGDVPVDERRGRAADLLDLPVAAVDAALDYYADFTDEVDADLEARRTLADELEDRWRRGQALLES